jgi:uncharacterized membrane protein
MRLQVILLRVFALVALAASGASLADSAFAEAAYCGFESGCGAVTASEYARPLGVPLPAVGLIGFGVVFGLTLFPADRAIGLLRVLAAVAGAVGLGLIVVQLAVLHQVCPLCLVADGSGLALAVAAFAGRARETTGLGWPARIVWIVAAVAAAGFPLLFAWGRADPSPPEQVTALWADGAVTLVELTDFDCPHCKDAEAALRPFLRNHPDVRFVRLPAPLPKHDNARPAARAYLAARAQGKGEEMAAALFAADDRGFDACRKLAAGLGLRLAEYDRTARDPRTEAELDATVAWARPLDTGVPVMWLQDRRFTGVPTPQVLEDAYQKAKSPPAVGTGR